MDNNEIYLAERRGALYLHAEMLSEFEGELTEQSRARMARARNRILRGLEEKHTAPRLSLVK